MRYRLHLQTLMVIVALVCAALPLPAVRAQDAPGEYIAGELMIKLFNANDLRPVANAYGLALPPLDQFGTRPIYRLRIADGTDPLVKAEQIKPAGGGGDARVEFAEPNYLAETPEGRRGGSAWVVGGDATTYAEQWAPAKLRLAEAHTVTRGAGVTVAVLDTGVDRTHPALAGRLRPGFDFVNFDDDPSEEGVYGVDFGFGHGTHVAGLVALSAPEARIMPVRVLDKSGVGNIWVLAEALLYAVDPDDNPATNDGATVINLSLGTLRPTNLLEQIVAEVTCDDDLADDDDDDGRGKGSGGGKGNGGSKGNDDDDSDRCALTGGAIVVAAAGNGGNSVPQYPAAEALDGTLAVAASTQVDTLAAFSTRGPWVRLSAPGEQIVSTVPGGAYATWSGTSMAAPSAAGVAALLRAQQPSLPADAVVKQLSETAQPLCQDGPARLDAARALGLPEAPAATCASTYLPTLRAGI